MVALVGIVVIVIVILIVILVVSVVGLLCALVGVPRIVLRLQFFIALWLVGVLFIRVRVVWGDCYLASGRGISVTW